MAKSKAAADPLADVSQFLGGEYLKAKDAEDGDLTFGITAVGREQFEAKKGQRPEKPRVVLTLDGDPVRKLSLNDTNLQMLINAWGNDARRWIGKVFDAYFDKTVRDPSGKLTGGLRVRARDVSKGAGANGSERAAADADPVPF